MSPTIEQLKANKGKKLLIRVDGIDYFRFPVKTHLISKKDEIRAVIDKYAKKYLQTDDLLFISERIVAITQGRAFPIKDIKPSHLAKFLVKFVHKSPYGIGLGSVWTMQLAIEEAGSVRIIFAALLSALGKIFGLKGLFYRLVGKNINAIDGPCSYTLPPYNQYAKLAPKNPQKVAQRLKESLATEIIIIDANDLGITVLGKSKQDISDQFCQKVFQDNPLGQSCQQTPLCIVRKA